MMKRSVQPSLAISVIPVAALLAALVAVIAKAGADSVQAYSYYILCGAASVALLLGVLFTTRVRRCLVPEL